MNEASFMISQRKSTLKSIVHYLYFIFVCALLSASPPPLDLNIDKDDHFVERADVQVLPHKQKIESLKKYPQRVYASVFDSNDILPLNLDSRKIENVLSLNFPAKVLAFSPSGQQIFLVDYKSGRLVKMDLASREIEELNAPEGIPLKLTVRSNGEQGYAIYKGREEILCLDFKKQTFYSLGIFEKPPHCIALASTINKLFVTFKGSSQISSIDIDTLAITPFFSLERIADDLMISSDGRSLYAVQEGGRHLDNIDINTKKSKKVSFEASHPFLSTDATDFFFANQKEELYIAKEGGFEVFEINFKNQRAESIVQFSKPISGLAHFPEPEIVASFTVEQPTVGESAIFDASTTKSQKQGTINYQWDFGDGLTTCSTNPLIEHTYTASGGYIATLTVTQDLEDLTDSASNESSSFDPHALSAVTNGYVTVFPANNFQYFNESTQQLISSLIINAKDHLQGSKPSSEMNLLALLPTTTTLVSSTASSFYGESVMLTATVSPSAATGTVTFMDSSTSIGTMPLISGSATLNIDSLAVGSHSLTAVYGGDSTYEGSTSTPALPLQVNQATPTVSLQSNSNPSTYAGFVTFTSIVTAPYSFGLPTGTVTFSDGSNPLQTVSLSPHTSNSAIATYSLNTLGGGPHTITATYNGDVNFTSAMSTALPQTVNLAATTATIISLTQSPTAYGEPIQLEAIIVGSPSNPPLSPSGTVTFYATSGGPPIALGTSLPITAVPNTNTVSTTFLYTPPPYLDVGTYTLYAVYNGDTNYLPSSQNPSSTISHVIVPTATSTTTTVADNCTSGSNVTLVATVTANAPGSGIPVGTVNFYDGFTLLESAGVISGQATITVPLSSGSHEITSIYIPSSSPQDFTGSTAPTVTVTVGQDDTTTTLALTGGSNPSAFGASLTFTATVQSACSANTKKPTGTVIFYNGSTPLATVSLANGMASFSICNLYPNTYSLTATYSGDATFNASISSPLSQTVAGTLNTTTIITGSSQNPVAVNPDTTMFTATVSAISTCPDLIPTGGTVQFYDESTSPATLLGTGNLINGTAVSPAISFPTVAAGGTLGNHNIIAIYVPGTAPFLGSTSAAFPQCVTTYDTEMTLMLTPYETEFGSATLTATVTAIGPGPFPNFTNVTVDFYEGPDLNPIGSASVPPSLLPANTSFTVSFTPSCLGCSAITAIYGGECFSPYNFDMSSATVVADLLGTQTTVAVSGSAPYYFCQPVTFTATVKGSCDTDCTPTGTVTFFDGTTAIGTALLEDGVATLTVSSLSIGSHSISATYNSDSFFAFSESTNTVTLSIVIAPTTTTLIVLPATGSVYGQTIILGATVTSVAGAGTPTTGSVVFSDENGILATVQIGSNGTALYPTQLIGGGSHFFTATYNPVCCSVESACYEGSSDTLSVAYTISPALPDLILTATPKTITYGDTIILNANVASYNVGTPTGIVSFYIGPVGPSTLLGTASLVNGIASLTVSNYLSHVNITAGSNLVINATYGGDANFQAANFPEVLETINKAPVTVTLVSDAPNASFFGKTVQLTASVRSLLNIPTDSGNTPVGIPPTGSVTFVVDGSAFQTVALVNGIATLSISSLSVGTPHTIIAQYSGDSNFLANNSVTFSQQVEKIDTQTTVISSLNPSTYNTSPLPVFTATVTSLISGQGTPTGTITALYGSYTTGPITLTAGTASFSIPNLEPGINTIIVNYSGDSNFNPSTGLVTQTVNLASTATTLVSTSATMPPTYGQPITFTATVTTPATGTPTGVVNFIEDGMVIGTGTLSSSSPYVASIILSNLSVSTTSPYHQIVAEYEGDGNFSPSTSPILNQEVAQAPTMTTITWYGPNASSVGEEVTFVATTAPNPAINAIVQELTGTVSFYNAIDPSNSATWILLGTVPTNGTAVFGTNQLPLAQIIPLNIIAVYSGDTNYLTSTSPVVEQTVNLALATTSTTLVSTSATTPPTYGEPIMFTATVTPTSPTSAIPTGVVYFIENGMVLGTGTLSTSSPYQASVILSNLSVSMTFPYHQITAEYGGDENFSSSTSAILNQEVDEAPTMTTISYYSPSPSMFGEEVTFIATITPNPPIAAVVKDPTGTVSFYNAIDPSNPATWILLGSSTSSNGIALFETNQLPLAPIIPLNIIAVYGGDTNYLTSTSPAVHQIVTQTSQTNTSKTTLTSNPNPSEYGCPVTFNILVTPLVPPNPNPGVPTGVVMLYYGTQPLTPTALPLDANGRASVTIPFDGVPPLQAGMLSIVALYSGDSNYSSSTAVLDQIVNPIATTLELTTSGSPSIFSEVVTFTAAVSATVNCPPSTSVVPTGSVSFYDGILPGGTFLGTTPLNSSGIATLSTNELSTGIHTITAVYNPDTNFDTSSGQVTQVVQCIPTITSILSASPSTSILGEEASFIASVSINSSAYNGNVSGSPIGSVTFYDTFNGVGPTPIGTVPVTNGLAILNISNLAVGTHNITAIYSGSTNFCSSALGAPGFQHMVVPAMLPTITELTSSLNPAEFGQTVVFTATVIDPTHSGIPTGTVTFFDGDMAIGTSLLVNGVAELSTSTLAIGSHPITAVYSGDSKYYPSSSSIYTEVIIPSPFPLPPHDFYGCQVVNKYLNFDEYVNILTWQPPQDDETIVRYEIYRDAALTKRVGEVKAKKCSYRFEDGNRKKDRTYKYYIVSVNAGGKRSPAVFTKVIPHHKKK